MLRILLVRLPLSAVPLYNVSEKMGPAGKMISFFQILIFLTWFSLWQKWLGILAGLTLRALILTGNCCCVGAENRRLLESFSLSSSEIVIPNQPGKHEGENLKKSQEHSAADVGEEEGKDIPSQAPCKHSHATVHVDCALGM